MSLRVDVETLLEIVGQLYGWLEGVVEEFVRAVMGPELASRLPENAPRALSLLLLVTLTYMISGISKKLVKWLLVVGWLLFLLSCAYSLLSS